jgi:hypothetical protein
MTATPVSVSPAGGVTCTPVRPDPDRPTLTAGDRAAAGTIAAPVTPTGTLTTTHLTPTPDTPKRAGHTHLTPPTLTPLPIPASDTPKGVRPSALPHDLTPLRLSLAPATYLSPDTRQGRHLTGPHERQVTPPINPT